MGVGSGREWRGVLRAVAASLDVAVAFWSVFLACGGVFLLPLLSGKGRVSFVSLARFGVRGEWFVGVC